MSVSEMNVGPNIVFDTVVLITLVYSCIAIPTEKHLPNSGSKFMFVPAFMVSNVQSVSPKIDEI